MYFVFLCFYKNEINITNKKKKKTSVILKSKSVNWLLYDGNIEC